MKLSQSHLCVDCSEIHESHLCPVCGSGQWLNLSRILDRLAAAAVLMAAVVISQIIIAR